VIPADIQLVLDADAQAYIQRLAGWPYAGVAPAADAWARRKYLFAKGVWPKRDEPCPGFQCTWAARFEQMWLEPLADYRARLHAAQKAAA
jgi:hypothetical protein